MLNGCVKLNCHGYQTALAVSTTAADDSVQAPVVESYTGKKLDPGSGCHMERSA
jgi:hypothetical protein